jgi:PEP-CTERM motif-containing protein
MKKWLFVALFVLFSVAPILSAQAATLTWVLQNVMFADGGTATGSFGYDADTNNFSAINITTSVNAGLGTTYGVPTGVGTSTLFDTVTAFPVTGESRLIFELAAAMTNLGGTIAINLFGIFLDVELLCTEPSCTTLTTHRFLTQGAITASPVPLPAALPLFAAGLGAMGFMGWRKTKKAA